MDGSPKTPFYDIIAHALIGPYERGGRRPLPPFGRCAALATVCPECQGPLAREAAARLPLHPSQRLGSQRDT